MAAMTVTRAKPASSNFLPPRTEITRRETLDAALSSLLKEAGQYLLKDTRINTHYIMKDGRTATLESAGNHQLTLTLVGLEAKQRRLQVMTHLTKSAQGKISWIVEKTWIETQKKSPIKQPSGLLGPSFNQPLLQTN